MENTLKSMVDFVLEISEHFNNNETYTEDKAEQMESCEQYARFLKLHLELWMFVPCDENNVPLKPVFGKESEMYYVDEFKEAKERVLFEGFEYINNEHLEEFSIIQSDSISFNYDDKYKTFEIDRFFFEKIEELVDYNLTLTNNALKIWE